MTIFGQEGIGRPDAEADTQIQAVKKHLAKSMEEASVPPIQAVLVFTSDQADIQADSAPLPAVHLKKLKDFIRQRSKETSLPSLMLQQVKACLPQD
jgi:hypothetical protein